MLCQLGYSQFAEQKKEQGCQKLFSFGLIADPQYADAEPAGNRYYRCSLDKLEKCVTELNGLDLAFTVILGDLIDRDYASFDQVLPILDKLESPVHKVIGNHDYEVEEKLKREIRKKLNNKKGYFDFTIGDFVFIVTDGTNLSTFAYKEGAKEFNLAWSKFELLEEQGANNALTWNGGFSSRQIQWLGRKLQKASKLHMKAVLFCHWPLLPENMAQLWDNQKVIGLLEEYDCVVAWISGHHHTGGYLQKGNIHYLTLKGMVESELVSSFGVMDVYNDKLVLHGYGNQEDLILEF